MTPHPTGCGMPPLQWTWTRFTGLSLQDLYDLLQLRARVFILEQGPYLDLDGLDQRSHHLIGRLAVAWHGLPAGEAVLYLRIVDLGVKFVEPSMGRVVVHPALRGSGLGHVLVSEGLRRCDAEWDGLPNRISAQAHLERFYGHHGYVRVGEPYAEDTIPHIQMLRPPSTGVEST